MDHVLFVHYIHYVEFGFRTQQVFRTLRCHWPLYPWICQLEMTGMRETPIQDQTGDQNDLLELQIHHSQPGRPAETRTRAKTWIGVATMLVGSKEVLIGSDAAAYLELFPSNHPNTKLIKLLSHPDIGKWWKMHQNHQIFLVGPPLKPGYARLPRLPGLHMSPPRLCCRLLSCPWLSLWTWLFQVLGDVVTHLSLGNVTPVHPAHRQGGDPRDRSMIQAADSTKLASSCVSVFNNRSKEAAPLAPIPAPRKHLWHAAFIQQSSWSMLNLKSIVPTPLRSGVQICIGVCTLWVHYVHCVSNEFKKTSPFRAVPLMIHERNSRQSTPWERKEIGEG